MSTVFCPGRGLAMVIKYAAVEDEAEWMQLGVQCAMLMVGAPAVMCAT